MADFIFGLNTEKYFADIQNPTLALTNLGIDVRDVDIIRGLAGSGVTRGDIKRLSGLNIDAKRELISIDYDLRATLDLIELTGISSRSVVPYDIIVDNAIRSASYKYNYVDYAETDLSQIIKGADISTSRLSSWSSFDSPVTPTSPIFYGGDLTVNQTPASSKSELEITGLEFTDQPSARKYSAEVPTHKISIEINGTPKQFYAMQGIPIEFQGFARNAIVAQTVTQYDASGVVRPTWEVEILDDGRLTVFENVRYDTYGTNNVEILDFKARERKFRLYYPPKNIIQLDVSGINMAQYPNDVLPELTLLDVRNNLLEDLPDFSVITPKLTNIILDNNPLYSGNTTTANEELNKFPSTIRSISCSSCFDDSSPIDISSYQNLTSFNMVNSYSSVYMKDTGATPAVNSDSITNYTVYGNLYRSLHPSITNSESITFINIQYNNITGSLDELGNQIPIAFAGNNGANLQYFYSLSNSHNIINFSGKQNLLYYYHIYSRNLSSESTITDKFRNLPKLLWVNLDGTDATGDITNQFNNLPSLRLLYLQWSRVHGVIRNTSFSGSDQLRYLIFAGSATGEDGKTLGFVDGDNAVQDNFFEEECFVQTTILFYLLVISNRNVKGDLPNFDENRSLFVLYISGTGITGGLGKLKYSNKTNFRYLYLHNNYIYEPVPQIVSSSLFRILLDSNELYGSLPPFNCPVAYEIRLQNNNIGKNSNGNQIDSLGIIPTFDNCRNLARLNLANNSFVGYTKGSFTNLLRITQINLSNNDIGRLDAFNILEDLYNNWQSNPRGGVTLNLSGNAKFTEGDIQSNETYKAYLDFLRASGWSIVI